jgi:hypothetical protein
LRVKQFGGVALHQLNPVGRWSAGTRRFRSTRRNFSICLLCFLFLNGHKSGNDDLCLVSGSKGQSE